MPQCCEQMFKGLSTMTMSEWVTLTFYWAFPHGSHRVELKISSASIHYLIILLSIRVSPQLCYKTQSNCWILLISKEFKGTFYLWFIQLRPPTLPLMHPIPLQQMLGKKQWWAQPSYKKTCWWGLSAFEIWIVVKILIWGWHCHI